MSAVKQQTLAPDGCSGSMRPTVHLTAAVRCTVGLILSQDIVINISFLFNIIIIFLVKLSYFFQIMLLKCPIYQT